MNADVFYTSDLHGSEPHYRQAIDAARASGARALLLGGDLAPHGSIELQQTFYERFFLPLIRAYLLDPSAPSVWWIMGNDDWAAHVTLLETARLPRFRHAHGRVLPFLDGWSIAGLACVPASPFALKDWERWEEGLGPATRWEGYRSVSGGGSHRFSFVGQEKKEAMAHEFEVLEHGWTESARTICMFHGPPHGTALDQLHGRVHVGSQETRRFLERRGPALSLHGHIHESPAVSGRYYDRVGSTLCVNPGQSPQAALAAVTFSMSDPAGTLRHTLLGEAR